MPTELDLSFKLDAPVDRVFDALTDGELQARWMPGFVERTLVSGDGGPGTTFRQVREMYGKRAAEVFEITAFDRPHRLALHIDGTQGDSGQGEFRFTYLLSEQDGYTTMRVVGLISMPEETSQMAGALFAKMLRGGLQSDYAALAEYLVTDQPANPSGASG